VAIVSLNAVTCAWRGRSVQRWGKQHRRTGPSDGTTRGGSPTRGDGVFPTLEVISREAPAALSKYETRYSRDRVIDLEPVRVVKCRVC